MDEIIFWKLIEDSWTIVPIRKRNRMVIATKKEYPERPTELGIDLEKVIHEKVFQRLKEILEQLSKIELFDFNKILEKKLYDLDRKEIYNYIEGSDDSFLYHRGFIVGMGKEYYNTILNNPSMATLGLSSEDFAYMTRAIYHELYVKDGHLAIFNEGISRESHSNKEGWK